MIRRIPVWLCLSAVFALCQWLAPAGMSPLAVAQASVANVTCNATITDINFGNVDPSAGLTYGNNFNSNANLKTTGFVTYYCTNTSTSSKSVDVCISLGNPGGDTQRTLTRSAGGSLDYQLYQDPANSTGWGSKYNTPGKWGAPYVDTVTVPPGGTSAPITQAIYATIDRNQVNWKTSQTGLYDDQFFGGDVALDTGPAGAGCNGASGGGSILGFQVWANMVPTCQVDTNPMDFGAIDGDPSNATATTTFTVSCVGHTGYRVGLDNGKNFKGNDRLMRGGPTHNDFIAYQLYLDSSFNQLWGNTDGTDTVTGTRSTQTFTVYGKVAPSQGMPPGGDYFDAVTVYVYY